MREAQNDLNGTDRREDPCAGERGTPRGHIGDGRSLYSTLHSVSPVLLPLPGDRTSGVQLVSLKPRRTSDALKVGRSENVERTKRRCG